MNIDCDKQLEADISRELRQLPELPAPDSLMCRVLAAIEQHSRSPWYRRSWQTWPAGLRWAALASLLMLFGGLCFAGWRLSHAETTLLAIHRAREWVSGLNMIGNTLAVLFNSAALAVKKLGTGFLLACLVAAATLYVTCVGLGSIYLRLALAKS